jgi:hypothetical protein
LKGSYAVYKKETLMGEGTGKLCHIHRPEIIDSRGRRCWGDLSIVGNRLCITIPENWLGEALYPVIVDPTVGTTTIGSQITGPDPNNSNYDRPWLDGEYALNRYLIAQNGGGLCTAYVYAYHDNADPTITPVLYSHFNNKPYQRKSKNEKDIYVNVQPSYGYVAGWRNNTFEIDGIIPEGEYIWFGLWGGFFTTRFDYGGVCYKGGFNYDLSPEDEYDGVPPHYMSISPYDSYNTIKWSWYFNYTAVTNQNHVRILTQGVSLTDNKKSTLSINRLVQQGITLTDNKATLLTLTRFLQQTVGGITSINRLQALFRKLMDNKGLSDTVKQGKGYCRKIISNAFCTASSICGAIFFRKHSDAVRVNETVFRGLIFVVRIVTGVFIRDYLLSRFLKAKVNIELKSVVCREIILESKIG